MLRYYFFGIFIMFFAPLISEQSLTYVENSQAFNSIPSIDQGAFHHLKNISPNPTITRFVFIRHGESTSNQERSIAGRKLDVELSEKGAQQASFTGLMLKDTQVEFDYFYSSPSVRAQQTVAYIQENLNSSFQPILDERLYEKFYGPYEGASEEAYAPVKQAEEIDNSGPDKSFEQKFAFKYHPEMESMADILARLVDFMKEKHLEHPGQNLLIGTHNGILKALFMADAAARGFDIDYRAFTVENCAVLVLEVEADQIRVCATNKFKFK